jgi:acyl-coenzyme A thioesterase PaaI-like protein
MSFASATAVSHVMGDVYQSAVEPGWDILGATNGGYLMAMSARAMARVAERPNPVTITAHYLNPAGPGPVTIDTNLVKTGKRFATVQARLNGTSRAATTRGVRRCRARRPLLPAHLRQD